MRWLFVLMALVQAPHTETMSGVPYKVGPPAAIADLDLGALKGELRRIAWSPDGASIYLQTGQGNDTHHYLIAIDGDRKVVAQPAAPEWSAAYWDRKASVSAPGAYAHVTIEVVKDVQKRDSSYLGGAPNLSGSLDRDPTPEYDDVIIYRVYDENVGRWVKVPAVPGQTYGWGPDDGGQIAFVDVRGQLIVRGPHARQAVPGATDATLPAWSPDGHKVAYARKTGRRKYQLAYVAVQ
jgi:hypothetical protein